MADDIIFKNQVGKIDKLSKTYCKADLQACIQHIEVTQNYISRNGYLPLQMICMILDIQKSLKGEKKAVKESAELANASEVFLVQEPMAAAIGIGIDVSKPQGNMIVDIGGGTTEIGVISLNGIGTSEHMQIAGDEQTKSIIDWFRNQHKLEIGERTAEHIKCSVGSAIRTETKNFQVKGKDLVSGISRKLDVDSDEIRQALSETVFQITSSVKKALDKTPAEHHSDILDYGIILTGGGAMLANLDTHIKNKTGLPVHVAEDPLLSVVKGTGMIVEDIQKYKNVLIQ